MLPNTEEEIKRLVIEAKAVPFQETLPKEEIKMTAVVIKELDLLKEKLIRVTEKYDPLAQEPLYSQKPLIGPAIAGIKTFLRWILKPYGDALLFRQLHFNVRSVELFQEWISVQESQSQTLKNYKEQLSVQQDHQFNVEQQIKQELLHFREEQKGLLQGILDEWRVSQKSLRVQIEERGTWIQEMKDWRREFILHLLELQKKHDLMTRSLGILQEQQTTQGNILARNEQEWKQAMDQLMTQLRSSVDQLEENHRHTVADMGAHLDKMELSTKRLKQINTLLRIKRRQDEQRIENVEKLTREINGLFPKQWVWNERLEECLSRLTAEIGELKKWHDAVDPQISRGSERGEKIEKILQEDLPRQWVWNERLEECLSRLTAEIGELKKWHDVIDPTTTKLQENDRQRSSQFEEAFSKQWKWNRRIEGRLSAEIEAILKWKEHIQRTQGALTSRIATLDELMDDFSSRSLTIPSRHASHDRKMNVLNTQKKGYRIFEDRFRGTEDDVKKRLRRYVNFFKGVKTEVLDVGCGRGEFLELLKQAGIDARGIDLNKAMVIRCKEKGLPVKQAEAIEFLSRLKHAELGGIFCAQVVEHMGGEELMNFLDLSYLKLKNGGTIVLETVNPLSLKGIENFTRDITHKRLIHPETLQFLLSERGFAQAQVLFHNRSEEMSRLNFEVTDPKEKEWLHEINERLFGYQDYAVIAQKGNQ